MFWQWLAKACPGWRRHNTWCYPHLFTAGDSKPLLVNDCRGFYYVILCYNYILSNILGIYWGYWGYLGIYRLSYCKPILLFHAAHGWSWFWEALGSDFLNGFELMSVLLFTFEYLANVWSANANIRPGHVRWVERWSCAQLCSLWTRRQVLFSS